MTRATPPGPQRPRLGESDPRQAIVDSLRRYGTESTRLGQVFAARHRLQPVDLRALVAIMGADQAGDPLTPGSLTRHLGLSSAGTSYVIDRLEEAGHVRRHRDNRDSRVVHLRHTPEGLETAHRFFGPLGQATRDLLDQFSAGEVEAIGRFLDSAVAVLAEHLQAVNASDPDGASGPT